MEEKNVTKISLSTFFLIFAIIAIIVMGIFIYKLNNDKTAEIQKSTELQTQVNSLNGAVSDLQGKISSISNTINSDNTSSVKNNNTDNTDNIDNIDNTTKIYNECEKQCNGVVYRRETGGSSGFFIKNGILYSGEENMTETQAKTSGITENVKYVVPLNKQTNKTIALTEDGKLYINKEENGLYGNSFERLLSSYNILEILQIPNEEELKFLSSDGKIININGTVYLNLL